jgi:hypothetical protein
MEKTFYRLRTIRLIGLILSPSSLFFYLILFAGFFVGGMFLADIEVVNRTETELQITPYSKYKGAEDFVKVPMQRNSWPHFYLTKSTNLALSPNKIYRISYDSDGHYIKGFLINTGESIKMLPITLMEQKNNVFEIKDIELLMSAPKSMVDSVFSRNSRPYIFFSIMLIGFLDSILLIVIQRKIKKTRNTVHNK